MQTKDTIQLNQQKFNRNYLMQIELLSDNPVLSINPDNNEIVFGKEGDQKNFVEIRFPFTVEFSISRTNTGSSNQAEFSLYLNNDTLRNQLNKARYNTSIVRKVTFQAGYNDNLSTIFVGTIIECFSYKQGADIITKMTCLDGGHYIYTGFSNRTIAGGATLEYLYRTIISDMNISQPPVIGAIENVILPNSVTAVGNSYALLQRNAGNNKIFIDFEQIKILGQNDVLENALLPLITSDTGLLGTPMIQGTALEVEMLFEPRITVSQAIALQSIISPQYNGSYRVNGISHHGIISGAKNGECKTKLYLTQPNSQNGFNIIPINHLLVK